jgi:hypothetical protein
MQKEFRNELPTRTPTETPFISSEFWFWNIPNAPDIIIFYKFVHVQTISKPRVELIFVNL